jgi:hypothetical protein
MDALLVRHATSQPMDAAARVERTAPRKGYCVQQGLGAASQHVRHITMTQLPQGPKHCIIGGYSA